MNNAERIARRATETNGDVTLSGGGNRAWVCVNGKVVLELGLTAAEGCQLSLWIDNNTGMVNEE